MNFNTKRTPFVRLLLPSQRMVVAQAQQRQQHSQHLNQHQALPVVPLLLLLPSPAVVVAQQLSHVHLPQQRQQPPKVQELADAVGIPRDEVLSAHHQCLACLRQPAEVCGACSGSTARAGGLDECSVPTTTSGALVVPCAPQPASTGTRCLQR